MRKKLLYVLLGVVLASNVLTACGKSNSSDNDKDNAQEESQTEAVVKEDEFQQITMGSYIDLGFAHFTFNKASRSQEIRHPYRGGFYYPDIPGESLSFWKGQLRILVHSRLILRTCPSISYLMMIRHFLIVIL